jgi:hypothetical protein
MKKIALIMVLALAICVVSPPIAKAGHCYNPYIAAGILGGALLGSAVITNWDHHDRVYYVVDPQYDRYEHHVTYHYHDGYNERPFYPDHYLPDSVTQVWEPGWTEKHWDGSYTYHPGRYIYVERNIER